MNKYQEALENIGMTVIDSLSDGYNEPKYVKDFCYGDYNKLQELVDKATKDEELSAKQMFEELGYEQTFYLGMLMYKNFKTGRTILFMESDAKGHEFKGVNISSTDKGFAIKVELLVAINQQCKELGWL